MLSKRVDATLGAFWNVEGVQLSARAGDRTIIRMEDVGVPTYDELILVARKDTLAERGDDVRALRAGARARLRRRARADPAAATDALVEAAPDLDRGFALASVKASLPAFFPEDAEKPFGWQDPRAWDAYGSWMFEQRPARRRAERRRGPRSRTSSWPGRAADRAHAAAATARSSGAVARSA